MSTLTRRVTLALFLLATFISFWGDVAMWWETQTVLKELPGIDLDFSGLHVNLLVTVTFLVATLSLWSRRATKIALCLLAIPWALTGLLVVQALARGFVSIDSRDGILVANFLLFVVALWSAFRSRLNLLPLLSLCVVLNQLLLVHLFATRQRAMFADPWPWFLSREPWWQLAILALSGLLFLSAARTAHDEWSDRTSQTTDNETPRKLFPIRINYLLNVAWIVFVGYFSVAFHVFGLVPAPVQLDSTQHFQEKLIAEIPLRRWYSTLRRVEHRMPPQNSVWISPDGEHVAYLSPHRRSTGTKWSVVHGDVEDSEFDEVGQVNFSPSGNHVAYAAREGKEWIVILDGQKGSRRGFDGIGELRWIRGASQLAYWGQIGHGWRLVVNDQISRPAGPADAFIYEDGTLGAVESKDGEANIFVDAKKVFGCSKGTQLISWWPEKQFACVEFHEGRQVLVFNGKPGPAVDHIGYPEHPSVSRDGKQVIYGALDGDRKFVVVGDRAIPFAPCADPAFGPDGRFAYLACEAGRSFLVVDGTPWPSFGGGGAPPVFSDDGKIIAYKAEENGKAFFVVNGRKGPEFDMVNYRLQFAPNSERYAYMAWRASKGLVVVGDKPGPEFDSVDEPVFSPDGNTVAYRAKRHSKQFVVVNDREGPGFDWVSTPVFSASERKVAYATARGRDLCLKVINLN